VLRLLLDIHISPRVAEQIRRHRPGCDVVSVRDWRDGSYREAGDDLILAAAQQDDRTLVTYDLRSIAPLLKEWHELGRSHGGVILVDTRTIAQDDIGGQVRSLTSLWDERGMEDWQRTVTYLSPSPPRWG